MIDQIIMEFFIYLLNYMPTIFVMTFDITILIFAILIYKRNSYKYGITLMISSIISLASSIIYISIQYPYLAMRLYVELGLPISMVNIILMTWSFVFLSLNTTSTILLIVSISQIYKTHKKDRID